MSKKFQKGAVSILLAVLILSMISVISIGISVLIIQQIKMSGQSGQSVVAFYAADAGAEKCLYQVRKNGAANCSYNDTLSNGAEYITNYNGTDTITSIGQFMDASRKVELSW
jgi:hypothetical protein